MKSVNKANSLEKIGKINKSLAGLMKVKEDINHEYQNETGYYHRLCSH